MVEDVYMIPDDIRKEAIRRGKLGVYKKVNLAVLVEWIDELDGALNDPAADMNGTLEMIREHLADLLEDPGGA